VIGRDVENARLVEVYVGDELMNEKLVRLGLALVNPRQINQMSQSEKLREAERFAQANGVGIYGTNQYSHLSDHYYIRGKSVSITNQIPQVYCRKGLTTAYQ
jgi:endonuclease YncB( thermonuclease family)